MFGPLTGSASLWGYPINNGAIALYKYTNAHGGINGRQLEIVDEDAACDPAKAVAAVKKLIYLDHVFIIHGGTCSAAVFAAKREMAGDQVRSEEHTSELQSLMRNSYAVFCLKKKKSNMTTRKKVHNNS